MSPCDAPHWDTRAALQAWFNLRSLEGGAVMQNSTGMP
jgi:hypothetical protein